MQRPAQMRSFVGNSSVVSILRRAVAQDRLPHALIFAGPAGVGKRTLALLLAQLLNCQAPEDTDACGGCRSCLKILDGNHPDVQELVPEGAFIKIERIRALIGEVAFQPFEGRFRVAILDGADQMRPETANSLLKTLEEPASRTFIVLVTTKPYALLSTIHSRCRMLRFAGIPQGQIESHLSAREGRTPQQASVAAAFSNGSLSYALSFDVERFQEIRHQAMRFVRLLLEGESFFDASALAFALAKDKEGFQQWLDSVGTILRDVFFARVSPGHIAQRDIAADLEALARSAPAAAVVAAIEAVDKLRRSVMHNVNRQIALEALYLSFPRASISQGLGGTKTHKS